MFKRRLAGLMLLAGCTHAAPAPEPAPQVHAAQPVQVAPEPEHSAKPSADVKNGAQVFAAKCASCHGANGDGKSDDAMYYTPPPTDFTKPEFKSVSDEAIAASIMKGKGNMPPFAKKLNPAQLAGVMAYLRTLAK